MECGGHAAAVRAPAWPAHSTRLPEAANICTVFKYNMTETTYTQARANFKALLDEASDSREIVIIHRRDGNDVAMIAADELRSLLETAHLLRSPKNAERLLRALARATRRKGRPETLAKRRRDVGLDK